MLSIFSCYLLLAISISFLKNMFIQSFYLFFNQVFSNCVVVPSSAPSLGATAKGHKSHDFCPQRAHQVSLRVVNHVADCAEFFVEPRTESCKRQKSVVGQVCSDPKGSLANRAAGELPKGRRPRTHLEKGDTEGTKSCPSVSNSLCLSTSPSTCMVTPAARQRTPSTSTTARSSTS